ncbi:MAG: glycosyltransferase family 2 protein [Candidatus Babeliaceae bacterium]|jgi:hypothetical protein
MKTAAINAQRSYSQQLTHQFYKNIIPVHATSLFIDDIAQLYGTPAVYDYIIIHGTLHNADIQQMLNSLHNYMHEKTRVIIDWDIAFWKSNRLSFSDVKNFLILADFEYITTRRYMLCPVYIPGLSWFFNTLCAALPIVNKLCLRQIIIAKNRQTIDQEQSVSVIIPCKNERGNIDQAVMRIPKMGTSLEIIFVEGNSQDNTWEEIMRIIAMYPDKNITAYQQTGRGKADAMRLGFSKAQNDILMILDADLTVMPEELPHFYHALTTGKGDFVNGCRLVYPMEAGAMQFLNMLANYFFGAAFSWIVGQRMKDTLCGTKVVYAQDYQKIVESSALYGIKDPFGDFDLIFGAARMHLKIIEVPVHYKKRLYGTTQIKRFYHGLLLLKICILGCIRFKTGLMKAR